MTSGTRYAIGYMRGIVESINKQVGYEFMSNAHHRHRC